MTTTSPQPSSALRRWGKALTLLLSVCLGMTLAVASLYATGAQGQSCCCAKMAQRAPLHDAVRSAMSCSMTRALQGCPCRVERDDSMPVGDVVAAISHHAGHTPMPAASRLHHDLPLARAPSATPTSWLRGQPPTTPLYLRHRVLLI